MSEDRMQPVANPDVEERARESVDQSRESSHTILIHNDDVTPFEYVIHTLGSVFMLSEELADHIAMTAHKNGSAVVVVRPRREAEKLVSVANGRAKVAGYPLTFTLDVE